jgi:hypothetical protein
MRISRHSFSGVRFDRIKSLITSSNGYYSDFAVTHHQITGVRDDPVDADVMIITLKKALYNEGEYVRRLPSVVYAALLGSDELGIVKRTLFTWQETFDDVMKVLASGVGSRPF